MLSHTTLIQILQMIDRIRLLYRGKIVSLAGAGAVTPRADLLCMEYCSEWQKRLLQNGGAAMVGPAHRSGSARTAPTIAARSAA